MIVSVCVGSSCHLRGSYEMIRQVRGWVEEFGLSSCVELQANFCVGKCQEAVSIRIDEGECVSLSPDNLKDFFMEHVVGKLRP